MEGVMAAVSRTIASQHVNMSMGQWVDGESGIRRDKEHCDGD